MSKKCDLTGIGAQAGNKVSHSQRKSRRLFNPNLHNVSLYSEALNQNFRFRITSATLRSIDHNGGFDKFLLTAKSHNLSPEAAKIRRKLKKVVPFVKPEATEKKAS